MESVSSSNSFSNQDDDVEYEVEEITGKKITKKGVFYKIKWKGYPISDSTWEPMSNLTNVADLIEEFEKKFDPPQQPYKKKLCPRTSRPTNPSMANRRPRSCADSDNIRLVYSEKDNGNTKSIDLNVEKNEGVVIIRIDAVKFIGDELFAYVVAQEGKEKKERMISTRELVEIDAPKLVKYYESKITLKKE